MKQPEPVKKTASIGSDVFDSVDAFFEKNQKIFLGICLFLAALLSYLLFDAKMSFATDDAEYIKRAYNFIHKGYYPSYQGPLYPLVLSLLFVVFGFKVLVFKLFSALFLIGGIYFFYRAFKGKVSYTVLFTVLFYLSINSYILYFGHETFTEAFVLFLEALGFFFFMKHIQLLESKPNLKQSWGSWLLFGLFLFLLSIAKNILILTVGTAVLFFLLNTEWMNAVYAFGSFLVFKLPYEFLDKVILKDTVTGQLDQQMRKDFYDPSKGYEDVSGYIDRFTGNFDKFFGVQFFKLLGIRAENAESSAIFVLIFLALVIFTLVTIWRKNRYVFFTFLYAFAILLPTLIALQTIWNDQWRLIVPYMPYVLLPFLFAIWLRIKNAKQVVLKPVFLVMLAIFVIVQLPLTMKKVGANSRGLKHYVKGDMLYGLDDHTKNFLEICEWIGQNLPANDIVGTGKPSEAFVYAKWNNFQRVPLPAPNESADSILMNLKKLGYTHLFIDGYGRPAGVTAQAIQKKYPDKLNVIQQKGEQEDAIYLLEIKY